MQLASLAVVLATANTVFGAPTSNSSSITTRKTTGINCNGSKACFYGDSRAAAFLAGYIDKMRDDIWINNGQHIACIGHICAFLQNTGGTWGSIVKQLAPHIPYGHSCKICGSVPYYFPQGNNNVADGELTFNYVYSPSCTNKLCVD
ncbi:Kp4-domain-containing protein [Mycena rebaudengoi]|nr:Kp4-domain-containing protein [Mycena rebaudengoi]KAJ7277922.1 Kp4-domain-containing protein [Mycena rebaudengoi]KAJ7278273.1 Kp4-domain-containing protein [Mycena rebaudengoi]